MVMRRVKSGVGDWRWRRQDAFGFLRLVMMGGGLEAGMAVFQMGMKGKGCTSLEAEVGGEMRRGRLTSTCAFAHGRHVGWIATESGDVVLHPSKGRGLVA